MTVLLAVALLFADQQPPAGANRGGEIMSVLQFALIIGAGMFFLFVLPGRQEKKRRAAFLSGIKKNDHVITASGIYGVVTDISKETNKVTLRIDESTGAKIRMELTAIARVLSDEPAADAPSK